MKTTTLAGIVYELLDERLGVYIRQDGKEIEVGFATVRPIGPGRGVGKVINRQHFDRVQTGLMALTRAVAKPTFF